jgi:HAD superfamily hydrolase (TIGR01459 family)
LARLRAADRGVMMLSNAPRRASAVVAQMASMGIGPELYDGVVTSGEEVWRHLAERPDGFYRALSRRCFHLGPRRDVTVFDGDVVDVVADLDQAEFIVCTGLVEGQWTIAEHQGLLDRARARRLPMICANPDLEVLRGTRRELCAGAIAQHYEHMGESVRYHGKPHAGVFKRCVDEMGRGAAVLVVGDSLRTDIAGAGASGLDSALVAGGILAEGMGIAAGEMPDDAALAALIATHGVAPRFVLAAFAW